MDLKFLSPEVELVVDAEPTVQRAVLLWQAPIVNSILWVSALTPVEYRRMTFGWKLNPVTEAFPVDAGSVSIPVAARNVGVDE